MDQQTLKNVLEMHRKWVFGEDGGARANLSGANLSSANLSGANLSGANLSGANLSSVNLSGANLSGANLSSANLSSANLSGANLYCANLYCANLSGANLSGANLSGANLSGANLSKIQEDFFKVLSVSKSEVVGLYDALQRGRIEGSCYEGECRCLVGTIAELRSEPYESLSIDLKPQSDRPIEKWFLGIKAGDTPQNNVIASATAQMIKVFATENSIALPEYKLVSSLEAPSVFEASV